MRPELRIQKSLLPPCAGSDGRRLERHPEILPGYPLKFCEPAGQFHFINTRQAAERKHSVCLPITASRPAVPARRIHFTNQRGALAWAMAREKRLSGRSSFHLK